jgi:hypothetical protein
MVAQFPHPGSQQIIYSMSTPPSNTPTANPEHDRADENTHDVATLEPEGRPLRTLSEILEQRLNEREEFHESAMEISESFQTRGDSSPEPANKDEDFPGGDEEDREGFPGPDKRGGPRK